MAVIYSDAEIAALVEQLKLLPPDWSDRLLQIPKPGHRERRIDFLGESGDEFRIILRLNRLNPLDFSIILTVRATGSVQLFHLRRYDGRSHEHTNRIEGDSFHGFHIHTATARYQESGGPMDGFAQPTDRYASVNEALRCLIDDANLAPPSAWRNALSFEDRP